MSGRLIPGLEFAILRPELIKTKRTLQRMSKEDLVEHVLLLNSAIEDEAIFRAQVRDDAERTVAQLHVTRTGSQRVIHELETAVRRLRQQVIALSDHAVKLSGDERREKVPVETGANVWYEKGLA
jgi:hypothetical protein